jgi:hypothetical protein
MSTSSKEVVEPTKPPNTELTTFDMSHSEENQYPMAPEMDHDDPDQEHYYGVKDPELVKKKKFSRDLGTYGTGERNIPVPKTARVSGGPPKLPGNEDDF